MTMDNIDNVPVETPELDILCESLGMNKTGMREHENKAYGIVVLPFYYEWKMDEQTEREALAVFCKGFLATCKSVQGELENDTINN